jgi:hypothetical protein
VATEALLGVLVLDLVGDFSMEHRCGLVGRQPGAVTDWTAGERRHEIGEQYLDDRRSGEECKSIEADGAATIRRMALFAGLYRDAPCGPFCRAAG